MHYHYNLYECKQDQIGDSSKTQIEGNEENEEIEERIDGTNDIEEKGDTSDNSMGPAGDEIGAADETNAKSETTESGKVDNKNNTTNQQAEDEYEDDYCIEGEKYDDTQVEDEEEEATEDGDNLVYDQEKVGQHYEYTTEEEYDRNVEQDIKEKEEEDNGLSRTAQEGITVDESENEDEEVDQRNCVDVTVVDKVIVLFNTLRFIHT